MSDWKDITNLSGVNWVKLSEAEAKVEEIRNQPQGYWYDQAMNYKAERDKARADVDLARSREKAAGASCLKSNKRIVEFEWALECILSELVVDHDPDEAARIAHAALHPSTPQPSEGPRPGIPQPSERVDLGLHSKDIAEPDLLSWEESQPSEGEEADGRG